ncbi:hypothetical protein B0H63DRAFT_455928 [Podospora didyma]|uniref:Uncharacterized protein n=1 Tax=Podospora didyma TaxID=330526 RepID=A0AAE0N2J5_9PEZI|nr:hypothetical protein B0H63DRAFT_455928 [Podospora didyma]
MVSANEMRKIAFCDGAFDKKSGKGRPPAKSGGVGIAWEIFAPGTEDHGKILRMGFYFGIVLDNNLCEGVPQQKKAKERGLEFDPTPVALFLSNVATWIGIINHDESTRNKKSYADVYVGLHDAVKESIEKHRAAISGVDIKFELDCVKGHNNLLELQNLADEAAVQARSEQRAFRKVGGRDKWTLETVPYDTSVWDDIKHFV